MTDTTIGRRCPECRNPDEDAAGWCDCERDGTTFCAGPCRNRAHDPERCDHLDTRVELVELRRLLDTARDERDNLARRILDIKGNASRGMLPDCEPCRLDRHACTGCGTRLRHGQETCDECTHHDCWVPVRLRWRHVIVGDTVVSVRKRGTTLWTITATGGTVDDGQLWFRMTHGDQEHEPAVDPDAVVPVLIAHAERAALRVAREGLGATVIGREA